MYTNVHATYVFIFSTLVALQFCNYLNMWFDGWPLTSFDGSFAEDLVYGVYVAATLFRLPRSAPVRGGIQTITSPNFSRHSHTPFTMTFTRQIYLYSASDDCITWLRNIWELLYFSLKLRKIYYFVNMFFFITCIILISVLYCYLKLINVLWKKERYV